MLGRVALGIEGPCFPSIELWDAHDGDVGQQPSDSSLWGRLI